MIEVKVNKPGIPVLNRYTYDVIGLLVGECEGEKEGDDDVGELVGFEVG